MQKLIYDFDRGLHRFRQKGFSLVEVVLAIGVISFCLIALLGLLAVAANAGRDSIDRTENTMLFDKVVNQLKTKPFDKDQNGVIKEAIYPLPALNNASDATNPFFVDDQNRYVGDAGSSIPTNAYKVVRVMVMDPEDLKIEKMQAPELLSKDGKLSFVRVEISSPAAGYKTSTKQAPHVVRYQTEITTFEQ